MRKITNREYERENVHGHYFLELTVENVRCFGKKQTIKLSDAKGKPYHWTILMGDNGVGKTSLLKSFVSIAPSPKTIFGEYQKLRLYPGLYDWKEHWDLRRHNGEKPSTISAKT